MSAKPLEVEIRRHADGTELLLRGVIDESTSSALERAARSAEGLVRLNFKHVRRVTSFGLGALMRLLDDLAKSHQVEYWDCSEVMVDQFQMLDFSRYGRIRSCNVRYFCERCEREEVLLLDLQRDLTVSADRRQVSAPSFTCRCGDQLRADDALDFAVDHLPAP